jgi:hypothetical protein
VALIICEYINSFWPRALRAARERVRPRWCVSLLLCAQGTRVNNIFKRRAPMPRVQGDECASYLRASLARNTRQNSPTHPSERSLILSRRELIRSAGEPRPIHSWAARNHRRKKNTHTYTSRWLDSMCDELALQAEIAKLLFTRCCLSAGFPRVKIADRAAIWWRSLLWQIQPQHPLTRPHLHVANSCFAPLRFRRSLIAPIIGVLHRHLWQILCAK